MADDKKKDAETPARAAAPADKPEPLKAAGKTDEGAEYAASPDDPETIVNLSIDDHARRFELHLSNRVYTHAGVDSEGRWTYRYTP